MKNRVYLSRIQVSKLFNRLTYDINLNNYNDVSILIAPNGCGKTTIFKLIDFIFSPNIFKYISITAFPFESFTCVLSNEKTIELYVDKDNRTKNEKEKARYRRHDISRHSSNNFEAEDKALYIRINDGNKNLPPINVTKTVQNRLDRYDDVEYSSMDEYSMRNIRYSYEDNYAASSIYKSKIAKYNELLSEIEDYLKNNECFLQVNFISADRLHKRSETNRSQDLYDRTGYIGRDPLFIMQREIEELYRKTDLEYKKLVSDARNRLPKMYLERNKDNNMTLKEFSKSWDEYISALNLYYQLGLLDSIDEIIERSELEKAFTKNKAFLSVYLEAFKGTLKPWEEVYERMKLFSDIINSRNRVTGKELKFSPDGIEIKVENDSLPLSCLSSGEKNDLIMFYNLIFKSQKNGLVLIDEPEISLHIEWQEEYLDRLIRVCEINSLQAIVATHSPNIVNSHFELYAEKGLVNERD